MRLSVLPLPKSVIGPAAKSLALQPDSGFISNGNYGDSGDPLNYPNHSFFQWFPDAAAVGRVGGYALDYGEGTSGGSGITEVWTSVDKCKTSDDAKNKDLAFFRQAESSAGFSEDVLSATTTTQKAAAVGDGRFAVLVAYSGRNVAPLFGLDEQFTVGRYEAEVTVWAGSAGAAQKLAPRLAKRLDARIKRALAGRLHARPVGLPQTDFNAWLPGTPDLASLALQTSDLSGQAYESDGPSSSSYLASGYYVEFSPAGQFADVFQSISWYPTANEAAWADDTWAVMLPRWDPLDLSGIGDGAWGYIKPDPDILGHGVAGLHFRSGQIEEVVGLTSFGATIQASQVQSLARIVANKINAAGFGS